MVDKTNKEINAKRFPALVISKEMSDIISYKPVWIVRNGIMLFFLIFCFFIFLSFFISYPDIITANGKLRIQMFEKQNVAPRYIADLILPQAGLNKIRIGQKVVLKFPDYPLSGSVTGSLTGIHPTLDSSGYIGMITLPEELKTSFGRLVPFLSQLSVNAQIITENRTLSERLFQQLKNKHF